MNYIIPSQISENFLLREFLIVSESEDIKDWEPFFVYLLPWIQKIRDKVNAPVKVTSFFRTRLGVSNSAHFKAMALDFTVPSFNGDVGKQRDLFNYIVAELNNKIRVCWYHDNAKRSHFYHIDCGRIYHPDQYPPWIDEKKK